MSLEQFSLHDKAALVIGASNPIGCAFALALAEAGARVIVTTTSWDKNEEKAADSCIDKLRALGCHGVTQVLDTTNEAEVNALVQRAVAELGRLDILVNAQDLPFAKSLAKISLSEWQRVLTANLTAVYLSCRAVSGPMLAQGKGRIINLVSLLSERGMANGSAYCAAQAGVLNFTRALALEWARSGVTVNAIGAGWTEGMGMIADEMLKQQLVRYLPAKRLAQPYEIGEAVVYLASDTADFLTGQVVWIDGGALSHL